MCVCVNPMPSRAYPMPFTSQWMFAQKPFHLVRSLVQCWKLQLWLSPGWILRQKPGSLHLRCLMVSNV